MSLRMVLLSLAILVSIVSVGLYYRVLQVAIFAIAAVINTPRQNRFSISPQAAESWASVTHQGVVRTPNLSGTAVTYHPEYHAYQASQAMRALGEASALGAEYIRADVRWSAVLPDGVTPNKAAFAWYRSFFKTAALYGLKPLIVLSSPPASVSHLPKPELLKRWNLFVEQVTYNFGDRCLLYQVLNEPNNPFYSIFDAESLPAAVMSASHLIKSHVDGAKVLVNFLVDVPHWRRDVEQLLSQTGRSIDVVGIDHYPGTWEFGPNEGWGAAIQMLSAIDTTVPGTLWYGRGLAIMETGFSTNLPGLRGPDEQKSFFADLEQNLRHIGPFRDRLMFVGFYELCDSDSHAFLNPEAHFGLLYDDCFKRKPAFDIAQKISLR